ncbi:MAG TPA: T9SS type A sorting domain-containing protein [Chitinophagaceae bacterium]|nr:T9SS type A sorting domain-containing protein [Chitinophagaceae bacterium]
MRTRILFAALVLCLSQTLSAQQKSRAFAITGINRIRNWENITEVNLGKALAIQSIYNKAKTPFALFSAETKKRINTGKNGNALIVKSDPTTTMVAAVAYDEQQGKLFFAPMRINELRWIDLNDKGPILKVYSATETKLINADLNKVSNQITRMCLGIDGYGYAMTNDALHLIRFSTGNKVVITDLGSVIDAGNKNTISGSCGGWGGDMVADTKGNLYVISSNHYVFRVNIETRVSTFVARINDIPENYTTNGAAVDDEGYLIVASANSTEPFYRVNPQNWAATPMDNGGNILTASDLASSNFLYDTRIKKAVSAIDNFREVYDEKITAYPNPVLQKNVKVNFEDQPKGSYSVQLMDKVGRILFTKQIIINNNKQMESFNIEQNTAQGLYLLRVMNSNKKVILAKKLLIQ